ncbi:MAG: dihydroorotate dehydrogenase [FCB group bacterium]|nr:dihydroorotate dehydrogenase [FCB group bacterium]
MFHFSFKGLTFDSPLLAASGTFGYGDEVADLIDINQLGGIMTKSVTLHPREGNPPPRIAETPAGMLNSIGLANPGVDSFIREILPRLSALETAVFINIAGSTLQEYVEVLDKLEKTDAFYAGYEINISCPNVKRGGMAFGIDPRTTERLTRRLRERTDKCLVMKLSPNVTRIEDIAAAAEAGGADALSAINTVVGMGIDIEKRTPLLHTVTGGLSGAAIKPIALAQVYKISRSAKLPLIGLGGISNYKDVIEFILAGADLVQIGTLNFKQPAAAVRIREELEAWCLKNNIANLHDLKGEMVSSC